jgi:hypothetical protein
MEPRTIRTMLISLAVLLNLLLGCATAYVITRISEGSERLLLWIGMGISLALLLWTLGLVSLTDPGFIPKKGEMATAATEELNLAYQDMYAIEDFRPDLASEIHINHPRTGRTLFECYSCQSLKPSMSTGHCSDCDRCIVGKDHHCIFLGTCVGVRNRGHFVAFLLSCLIACILSFVLMVRDLVKALGESQWPVVGATPLEIGLLAAFGVLLALRLIVFPFILSYSANLEMFGFIFLFGFAPLVVMIRADHIPWFSAVPAYIEGMMLFFLVSNLYYQIKLLGEGSTIRDLIQGPMRSEEEREALVNTTRPVTVISPMTMGEILVFTLKGFWFTSVPKYMI